MASSEKHYAPKNFASLAYPLDHAAENFYPEMIKFTFKKRVGVGLRAAAEEIGKANIAALGGKTYTQYGIDLEKYKKYKANIPDNENKQTAIAEHLTKWKNNHNQQEPNFNHVQLAIDTVVGGSQNIVEKNRILHALPDSAHIIGSILLNMPQAIAFENNANWGAKSLGAIGNAVKNLAVTGGIGDASGAAKGVGAGAAGNVGGAGIGAAIGFLGDKLGLPAGTGVGALAGAFAAGGGIQSGLEAAFGVAMNPYEEMMFSGITFREFNFEFTFRPRGEKEIKAVEQIIKMFRLHTRPSWVAGFNHSFMNNPQEFDIDFLTTNSKNGDYVTNEHLPKTKTCVCDKVSTNYTPNSVWASYRAGEPVSITMGLGFKEKELVMAEDIDEGGF